MAKYECCSILIVKNESYGESILQLNTGRLANVLYIIGQLFPKITKKNTSVPSFPSIWVLQFIWNATYFVLLSDMLSLGCAN